MADEIKQRSGDLKDGSVRGLSIEEARRIVASEGRPVSLVYLDTCCIIDLIEAAGPFHAAVDAFFSRQGVLQLALPRPAASAELVAMTWRPAATDAGDRNLTIRGGLRVPP